MADLTCGTGGSLGAEVINRINENTHAIEANGVDIQTNLDLASDNASNITVNTTNIQTNTTDVLALQELNGFYSITGVDQLNLPETYTIIATLNVPALVAGTYLLGISSTYQLDTAQKSVFARFTLNNGVPEEFSKEPKDSTDREAFSYGFPYVHAVDGEFNLVLELRKEDATGVLDPHFANLWLDKKL